MAMIRLPTMILSSSRSTPLPPTLLLILLFQLVCALITHAIRFNYSSFDAEEGITPYGDAYFLDGEIQLTKNQVDSSIMNSTGSVVYDEPVPLWDKASGKLADFSAHFSFVIFSKNPEQSADGLAFFLSSYPYHDANNTDSYGGALGLFNRSGANWTTPKQIVAVEFDTFQNQKDKDSSTSHMGIDINNISSSVAHQDLNTSIADRSKLDVHITYNASIGKLTVFLGNSSDPGRNWNLSYDVNLRDYLPENVVVGFSAATGNQNETNRILSWNFSSTDPRPRHKKFGLGLGLAIAAVVLLLCGLCSVWFIRKYICRKVISRGMEEDDEEEDMAIDILVRDAVQRATGPRRFPYSVLVNATNNFAAEGKLGQGGFGEVYVGVLHDPQLEVAIKKISRYSKQGRKEYISEISISQLRHRNLVQLIGYCHKKDDFLLVYEYMPNGSLDYHLYNKDRLLAWPERYRIALGLASALLYLHEEWEQCVIHRDVKPSNVMLDLEFNAKLGDFGLSRLVDHDSDPQTTVLMGTRGYMAPEYCNTGKTRRESDVYSFGVVILEIACGKRPIEARKKESEVSLVEWVWELYGKGMCLAAADGRLNLEFDEQQMQRLMIVGLWCAHPAYNFRPSIRQAIHVLKCDAPLPNLPSEMPIPVYHLPTGDLNNLASSSFSSNSLTSISGR